MFQVSLEASLAGARAAATRATDADVCTAAAGAAIDAASIAPDASSKHLPTPSLPLLKTENHVDESPP